MSCVSLKSTPKFAGVPTALVGVTPPQKYLTELVSMERNTALGLVRGLARAMEALTQ